MPNAPKQTFLRAKLSDGSTVEFDSEPLASGGVEFADGIFHHRSSFKPFAVL